MSRKFLVALVLVGLALALPVLAFAAAPAQTNSTTITLNAENNSGETGTAVLTDLGNNQVKVDVTVSGEPAGASQPMHIHNGQCGPNLGGVALPLTPLVNGKSTTTVNASLASILDGNHAINGHKSAQEVNVFVFCGNLTAASAAANATSTSTATTAPAVAATTAPTMAAATPAATSTVTPGALPTTGGDAGSLIPLVAALGLLALGAGLMVRRSGANQ